MMFLLKKVHVTYVCEESILCKTRGCRLLRERWFPVNSGAHYNLGVNAGHKRVFSLAWQAKTILTGKNTHRHTHTMMNAMKPMWKRDAVCVFFALSVSLGGPCQTAASSLQTPRNPTPADCLCQIHLYLKLIPTVRIKWDWAAVQYNDVVRRMVCFSTVLSF